MSEPVHDLAIGRRLVDGTATAEDVVNRSSAAAVEDSVVGLSFVKAGLAEGYHYATILGANRGGFAGNTWIGSATPGERTSLTIGIRG